MRRRNWDRSNRNLIKKAQVRKEIEKLESRCLPGSILDVLAGMLSGLRFDSLAGETSLPEATDQLTERAFAKAQGTADCDSDPQILVCDLVNSSFLAKNRGCGPEGSLEFARESDDPSSRVPWRASRIDTLIPSELLDHLSLGNSRSDAPVYSPPVGSVVSTTPSSSPAVRVQLGSVGVGSGSGFATSGAE